MQKKDTEGLEEDLQNIDWIGGTALHMLILLNCIIMSLFINNNNNNNNILYLDTLSREETLFKGVYIGTIIYKLRTL